MNAITPLSAEAIDAVIVAALAEDEGSGDVTSAVAVPSGTRARARLVARQAGVLSGIDVFLRVFEHCDAHVSCASARSDGESLVADEEIATIVGDARALLLAERTALNFLQRMSGIATQTAELVALAAGRTRILDTRKTTPGLRTFEKYAVRCGGGENHRIGLYDQVLLKENHFDLASAGVEATVSAARQKYGDAMCIIAEARDEDEARAAVRAGADVVMLDNMAPLAMRGLIEELRALASARGRKLELEASGGIDHSNLAAVAELGIERVSVGALTHSVRALDFSLYVEPVA